MTRRLGPFRAGAPFSFSGDPLTVQLLTGAPKQIIAGDSIDFLVPIPTDLSGWTGSARLTGPSATMNGTVATEGSSFRVTFPGQSSEGTKKLPAGQYTLAVWATSGNDRYTVATYSMTVTADLAVGTPAQSHAAQMLTLIETELRNRLNGQKSIESYAVDGVNITKIATDQLERMRARYANEVAMQNNGGAFGSVKFAFTPAGVPVGFTRRYS